jgi:hypothetical protein
MLNKTFTPGYFFPPAYDWKKDGPQVKTDKKA